MDLTGRVTALEEEVSVLKGEIKAILQEVRTAVLAKDNPFVNGGLEFAVAVPAAPPAPVAPVPAVPPPATETVIAPSTNGHSATALHEVPAPVRPEPSAPPANGRAFATAPAALAEVTHEPSRPQRWSVHSLAALMSWTQESAQRFNAQDLGIVLSLARYGGLIEKELEDTLATLAESLAPEEKPQRAGSTDFLLALRQLDALLDEAGQPQYIEQPARRAS